MDQLTEGHNLSPKSARKLRLELQTVREKSLAHEKLLFYLAETSPLLEDYNRILQTPVVKRGFMSRKRPQKTLVENAEVIQRKREIYTDFLRIANNYRGEQLDFTADIPEDLFRNSDENTTEICEECGSQNITLNVSDSMICCMDCAYEFTMSIDIGDCLPVTTNTDDSTYTNTRYEAILHFRSSMAKYQGKQQTTIPPELYEELHGRFARAGLLPEFAASITFPELVELTRRPPPPQGVMDRLIHPEHKETVASPPFNGVYSRITRDHIITFLQQSSRHEKHYEDLMLIHYTLTGVNPPNIGHLEGVLEQDFQILMGLYHQEYVIKQNPVLEDGKSFKSNYYILYHLLKKHGYRARRQDFSNMLKTPDREIFYDTVCKNLFGKLGWSFTSEF